jgi:hypothetical protein
VREFDFLPEWYKQGQRRQSHMRKQYIALVAIFLAMMAFNVTATHRASTVAAELVRLEGQRVYAEGVTHEFNRIIRRLNELKTKASLIGRIDPRIDVAAILAELSHVIGEPVVLNRVELIAEPMPCGERKEQAKTQMMIRVVGRTTGLDTGPALGGVRFRVVLAGVAAHPAHVADLVCKLDESPYFQQVSLSFSRGTRIEVGEGAAGASQAGRRAAKPAEMLDVTEFEIVCYLANYEEVGA